MSVERKSTVVTLWLILLAVSFFSVLPFFWIVLGSFKPHIEVVKGRLSPWQSYEVSVAGEAPSGEQQVSPAGGQTQVRYVTLENYKHILTSLSGLPTYYFNTIYLSIGGTILALFIGGLAAYGFARFRFPGNKTLFALLLLTIMIPGEVTLIGRYELMFQLKLYDKIAGLLIGYVAGNLLLVIFIMRNVFASISQDIIDSAMIDGANTWQVFWEIMVPIGGNGFAACGLLTFLGIWNEFLFALTFTSMDKVRTLPVGIVMLKGQFGLFNNGVLFATVLLSFLPIVVVFVLLQKYFVRGLSAGALKG